MISNFSMTVKQSKGLAKLIQEKVDESWDEVIVGKWDDHEEIYILSKNKYKYQSWDIMPDGKVEKRI